MTDTPQTLLDKLRAALARTVVKSLWYEGKTIQLDGYDFVNCRFDRCHLTHFSADWKLEGCALVDCTIEQVPVPPEAAAFLARMEECTQAGNLAGACQVLIEAVERNGRADG